MYVFYRNELLNDKFNKQLIKTSFIKVSNDSILRIPKQMSMKISERKSKLSEMTQELILDVLKKYKEGLKTIRKRHNHLCIAEYKLKKLLQNLDEKYEQIKKGTTDFSLPDFNSNDDVSETNTKQDKQNQYSLFLK